MDIIESKNTKAVLIKLPAEDYRQLKLFAFARHKSATAILRELVKTYLAEQEK